MISTQVRLDEWGVDAAYAGGQKALSCPPGIAPLTFGDRALTKMDKRTAAGEQVKMTGPMQCENQPVRQADLEVLFIILAASMQHESAWRPRTRRLGLIHPNV